MRYPQFRERFEAKVERTESCWLWRGARYPVGYGVIWRDGKNVFAHRAAWELVHGVIPDGLYVLHKCDNPPCVNPAHLFLGTKGENCTDRSMKGRDAFGVANGLAKLTDDKVRCIRSDARSTTQIAKDYGVSRACIYAVKELQTWRHV
jgi:hypothetical protein